MADAIPVLPEAHPAVAAQRSAVRAVFRPEEFPEEPNMSAVVPSAASPRAAPEPPEPWELLEPALPRPLAHSLPLQPLAQSPAPSPQAPQPQPRSALKPASLPVAQLLAEPLPQEAVCVPLGGGATTTGGRAITGPTGGLLAIAGVAGTTIGAACRGCGITRLGAGATGAAVATGTFAGAAGRAGATAVGAAGGRTVTAGRCGMLRACSAACLRSRIKRIASPGLEMCERSKVGALSAAFAVDAPPLRLPFR